ncbi:hypothetical protein Snoj_17900 [Streptomyces nojiriensis]|uniref:Uncharacterized protein n=1 Tax=Streptomyces nojiriensis TaxID=66374 RepID=A0ABQ3SIA7_9ACTN|nr:hypothetical protein [Streptomyces nojiriensis]GGS35122.1 hypothetical protein GCM10010205_76550 [Streptomyces nojiriensis]GHI67872.1 hypothetical protein Snoj_17900 [Streptomyces nojiriensis]
MTAVQAQEWQALLDALETIGASAAKHHLPLPAPLSAWGERVVPVGRLSFPTSRVVNGLARHRPFTDDSEPQGAAVMRSARRSRRSSVWNISTRWAQPRRPRRS